MSGKAVGWAMEQRTGSPTTKLVLLKLADNANEWKAWPSVQLIAEDTELSERAVRKHLRDLEKLGIIRKEERYEDGAQLPTLYHLIADSWVPRKAGERIPKLKRDGAQGAGVGHAEPPGHDVPQHGAQGAPSVGHDTPPNPYTKPLGEPSLTPESENIASLRMPEQARFPEFRRAVADTWPDGFPPKDQAAALREFTQLTRRVSADTLIACAQAHGEAEMARKAKRGPGAGQLLIKFPSNWLKAGDWEGYIPTVEKNCAKEAGIALALARVCLALGNDMVDFLKRQGMHDNALAALDGVTLEPGPPPVLVTSSGAQPHILAKYQFALERRFGDGLIVMPPPVRRTA